MHSTLPVPMIPVTIIGGYLGSGKTSLLNHLLRNHAGARLAVMVNDFGNLPIDAILIESQHDDVISLTGGCVCCSYGNDLTMALIKLQERAPRPDQIIIESSGVALPGSIASTVGLLQGLSVDGVMVLVDADAVLKQAKHPYLADTIERQLAQADIILVNKTDLISSEQLQSVLMYLQSQNNNARILQSQHAQLPPSLILTINGKTNWANDNYPNHTASHKAIELIVPDELPAESVARALADKKSGLVRAKGFIRDENGDMKTLQVTGSRWQLSDAPENAKAGLVCIGIDKDLNAEELRRYISRHTV